MLTLRLLVLACTARAVWEANRYFDRLEDFMIIMATWLGLEFLAGSRTVHDLDLLCPLLAIHFLS
jgi:hypothetical protein